MLKTILFTLLVIISYFIAIKINNGMDTMWQIQYFKSLEIKGIVTDTLKFKPTSKRKCGLVITPFNKVIPTYLELRKGCAFVNLLVKAQLGDTVLKEPNTDIVRIKNKIRDTIINSDQEF